MGGLPFQLVLEEILFASAMTGVMVFAIREFHQWKTERRGYLSLYIALGMAVMNFSLAQYLYDPSNATLDLALSGGVMFLALYPSLSREIRISKRPLTPLFVASLVASEVGMGLLFTVIEGSTPSFQSAVENGWFVAVMVAEMAYTAYLSSGVMRKFLLAVLPTMLLFPPAFSPSLAGQVSFLDSFIMIGSTIVVYDTLYTQRLRKTQDTSMALQVVLVFLGMMGSEFLFFLYSSWVPLDLVMVVASAWYLWRSFSPPKGNTNYLRDSRFSFVFILSTFIMEWFMGGVMDFVVGVFSTGVSGYLSSLPLPWVSPTSLQGVFWDALAVFSSVTGSFWFLLMMGIEMGFLALKKLSETRIRENRVRIALMISAYALYTLYIPTYSPLSSDLSHIPYMWSMGIGTLGPVTGEVLVGLVGTYVVSAVLSFLFGSRQVCSVTCTAPLMYQGTFYDSLKVYNRSSSLGKKTLTSRISPLFKVVFLAVNLGVLASAVFSYLSNSGVIGVSSSVYGVDITQVIYTVWFNVLWYVVFIAIPFMGTYACATQGWCYWGGFNQLVSRIGLFRLRARDPEVCAKCTTVDCANACPVGLTDMRGSFMRKGEFRSLKCVGVGDCAEACPHNNILFYDIRGWLRDKLSWGKRGGNRPKSQKNGA